MHWGEGDGRNPHGLSCLVLVDVTPEWWAGADLMEIEPEKRAVFGRLAAVCAFITDGGAAAGLPVVPVNSAALDYLRPEAFRGRRVGLAGIYGGLCVAQVAAWLRRAGASVTLVRDCIAWPPDQRPRGRLAQQLFPPLARNSHYELEPDEPGPGAG